MANKSQDVKCEACDAGYRLTADGLHYDHKDWTWGVCRKVVAAIKADMEPSSPSTV